MPAPASQHHSSVLFWLHLLVSATYGVIAPLWFGFIQGWGICSIPIAAMWMLLNIPVIEGVLYRLCAGVLRALAWAVSLFAERPFEQQKVLVKQSRDYRLYK